MQVCASDGMKEVDQQIAYVTSKGNVRNVGLCKLFVSSCQQSFYTGIFSSADGRTASNTKQLPSCLHIFCNVRPANNVTVEMNGRRVPGKKRLPARQTPSLYLQDWGKALNGARRRESKKRKDAWS